ncbi:hypothetical protein FJZ26_04615 [Candidatus Parvarchaeota archaeon]|nr:hypothetical protein [Candidatus Parvarchaeota archaeon]
MVNNVKVFSMHHNGKLRKCELGEVPQKRIVDFREKFVTNCGRFVNDPYWNIWLKEPSSINLMVFLQQADEKLFELQEKLTELKAEAQCQKTTQPHTTNAKPIAKFEDWKNKVYDSKKTLVAQHEKIVAMRDELDADFELTVSLLRQLAKKSENFGTPESYVDLINRTSKAIEDGSGAPLNFRLGRSGITANNDIFWTAYHFELQILLNAFNDLSALIVLDPTNIIRNSLEEKGFDSTWLLLLDKTKYVFTKISNGMLEEIKSISKHQHEENNKLYTQSIDPPKNHLKVYLETYKKIANELQSKNKPLEVYFRFFAEHELFYACIELCGRTINMLEKLVKIRKTYFENIVTFASLNNEFFNQLAEKGKKSAENGVPSIETSSKNSNMHRLEHEIEHLEKSKQFAQEELEFILNGAHKSKNGRI